MHLGLRDDVSTVQPHRRPEGEAPAMTRWDAPLGGDPLRPIKDKRKLWCRAFGCEEHQGCYLTDDDCPKVGCACGHGTCTRCGSLMVNEDDCEALVLAGPTLRCRLFGCKPGGDEILHMLTHVCSCGLNAHAIPGESPYGVVHEGCCVRCGRPILPTARLAR